MHHAFFCYDTSGQGGGQGIMPLNAVAEEGSFMMLFTGPELLELARPSLQQLGAFNVATNVQPAQVPAMNVYEWPGLLWPYLLLTTCCRCPPRMSMSACALPTRCTRA